ncbi:MAG: LPXTG cell wall anchor domain-containing protein [Lachnospiraceae bacterium]
MQELVREYLGELRSKRRKRRRISVAVTLLVVMVAGGVIGALVQYGVAMTGDAKCGIEEHTHSDECYADVLACGLEESEGHTHTDACYQTESTLVCGLEESEATEESEGHVHGEECYVNEQILICGQEESEGHMHTDACNQKQLACGKEEHIHTDACYIDTTADVEDASVWDAQYKDTEWKDAWGEDLVTAAKAQVGYKESTKNYTVAEDGSHKGYTRYGQFAGDVYADWDAMFVDFCMHYAGVKASGLFPGETVTSEWYDKFIQANETNQNYITAPEGYEPKVGDLIFFNKEGEETAFQMGVVSSYNNEKNEIEVIEGNCGNEVKENKYDIADEHITAYLKLTELEKVYKNEEPEQVAEPEAIEESTEGVEENQQEETAEEEEWAYEESYDADKVVVHVKAKEGVIPEGAELSVTPIEKKEVTEDMTEEEVAETEKVNEQYELTNQKLEEESKKKEEKLEGFVAYDICFLVDGEEVEPSGEVKVTMDFKEAMKPGDVSKNAEVAVSHLKENINEEDGIKIENLTDSDVAEITTAEENKSVEKVELIADSFSVFVITWIVPDNTWGSIPKWQMNVSHVKENGDVLLNSNFAITDTPISFGVKYRLEEQLKTGSITTSTGEVYTPSRIRLISAQNPNNGYDVDKIMADENTGKLHFYYPNENGEDEEVWYCTANLNNFSEENLGNDPHWAEYWGLQIIYQNSEIEIVDNIKTSGDLTIKLSENLQERFDNATGTKEYVWYKKINGGEFTITDPVPYESGRSNISGEYNEILNVALDNGAKNTNQSRVEYKVELKINGEIITSSAPFLIPYYNEVQNGSFEETELAEINKNLPTYEKTITANRMGGWKTTATDGYMEVANVVNGKIDSYYNYEGYFSAADGVQFAEINANQEASLYQDVLTIRGVQLNYSFAHRARPGNNGLARQNEMYLVIVPTFVAEKGLGGIYQGAIDTQDEITYLMEHRFDVDESKADKPLLYPGVYVQKYTANIHDWTEHSGIYTPQYDLNRFFFVSAESNPHEGNFIDNVWFSQQLPKPKEDTCNFRIVKTISGLDNISSVKELEELIKTSGLNFEITINKLNESARTDLEGIPNNLLATDMEWTDNQDGTYTGVKNYYNIPLENKNEQYKISVEEKNADISDFILNTSVTRIIRHEGDTESTEETESGRKQWDVTVKSGSRGRIVFNNAYSTVEDSYGWKMVKYSSSSEQKTLPGAVFNLRNGLNVIAKGISDESGVINWMKPDGEHEFDITLLTGEYTLAEAMAPTGYQCSSQTWELKFENGVLDVDAFNEKNSTKLNIALSVDDAAKVCEIKIKNTPLYSLPSTGGSGVYWYMFSGILLMAGAALITYKKRCGEVLRS